MAASFIKNDTIAAVATAPLAAGVAVIRLSGPQAKAAACTLCPSFQNVPARKMHFGLLAQGGDVLDESLLVAFNGPNSFTGEDVVEIHCHGGRAVVQGVLNALMMQEGVRAAEAGEFSRRAFINGKMDLTEAEGLADLIGAETEEQRRQALRQMQGELGKRFEKWRADILHLVAHVEAAIDFPDEELEVLAQANLKDGIQSLLVDFEQAIAANAGRRMREGFSVAVLGRPNAGKSTLTNLLTGKETAIVSPIEGTTRDVLETHLNVGGFPVVLADTAGLRLTDDAIEKEGVKRAKDKAAQADLVILVADSTTWPETQPDILACLQPKRSLVVLSKADVVDTNVADRFEADGHSYPVLQLNLTESNSLTPVLAALEGLVRAHYGSTQEAAQITRERHRSSIEQAMHHLRRALDLYENPGQMSLAELLAQDLRDAAQSVGQVTGRTDTEDVLDVVFSTFCVGK